MRKDFHFSDRTIVDWCSFCKEVLSIEVLDKPFKICGLNSIVEIDEFKFVKHCIFIEFLNNICCRQKHSGLFTSMANVSSIG